MLKAAKSPAEARERPIEQVGREELLDMATIRASCPDCGDVELTTVDVHVRICDDNNQGTYAFRCPHCSMMVVKPAESRTIDLLVASGVAFTTWRLPAGASFRSAPVGLVLMSCLLRARSGGHGEGPWSANRAE